MSHRVISGSAKGRRLKGGVSGTRPIMDRAKEALFNILGVSIYQARILDLFAGTGAVGIEALSRGAAWCTFVDANGGAIAVIHENLRTTNLADRATVQRADAFQHLRHPPQAPYSLIYIAPPQYEGLWKRAILTIDAHPATWLEPDGMVVVQIDPNEQESVPIQHLTAFDERTYGNTLLWFFEYIDYTVEHE
ncbi:MAG: 16S rRNA (guanine(966)-N(2))-methyltransferase RsmD [Anaerolineales bacterium]